MCFCNNSYNNYNINIIITVIAIIISIIIQIVLRILIIISIIIVIDYIISPSKSTHSWILSVYYVRCYCQQRHHSKSKKETRNNKNEIKVKNARQKIMGGANWDKTKKLRKKRIKYFLNRILAGECVEGLCSDARVLQGLSSCLLMLVPGNTLLSSRED